MTVLDGGLTCSEHHATLISSQYYKYFKGLYNARRPWMTSGGATLNFTIFLTDHNSWLCCLKSSHESLFLFCFLFMLRRMFPCLGIQNAWVCNNIIIIVIIADLVLVPTSGGFWCSLKVHFEDHVNDLEYA